MSDDNIQSIRDRMAAKASTETAKAPEPDTGAAPLEHIYEVQLSTDPEPKQVYGFFSFNGLGLMIATNKFGAAEPQVTFISPWASVVSLEIIEDVEDTEVGDGGSGG